MRTVGTADGYVNHKEKSFLSVAFQDKSIIFRGERNICRPPICSPFCPCRFWTVNIERSFQPRSIQLPEAAPLPAVSHNSHS